MADDGPPTHVREVTSDYEPSQDGSVFGSLSSSVKDHVWEYGRYALIQALATSNSPQLTLFLGDTICSSMVGTPYLMTRK